MQKKTTAGQNLQIWLSIILLVVTAVSGLIVPFIVNQKDDIGKVLIAPAGAQITMSMLVRPPFAESHLQILYDGKQISPEHLVETSYSISNSSAKPILPEDFAQQVIATPEPGVKILAIQPTSALKRLQQDWSENSDGTFSFRSQLLNPNETLTYQAWFSRQTSEPVFSDPPLVSFSGKIKNVNVITFSSLKAALEYKQNSMTLGQLAFGQMYTFLSGRAIVVMLLLVVALWYMQSLLLQRCGIIPEHSTKGDIFQLFIFAFSITTSEILTDIFLNGTTQHPIIYPLLFCHAALVCYVIFRLRTSQKSVP